MPEDFESLKCIHNNRKRQQQCRKSPGERVTVARKTLTFNMSSSKNVHPYNSYIHSHEVVSIGLSSICSDLPLIDKL